MKLQRTVKSLSALYFLLSISLYASSLILLKQPPALGAEKIKLIYGPFNGRVSIDSLKTYAETGKITGEFRLYAKFIDKETLAQLRYWLQQRFESDRVELYDYTHSLEGKEFLEQLGTAVKTHPQRNGFYAIRSALIEAADKPSESDGWTLLDAMYKFPTEDLQINTRKLFKLQKFWEESEMVNKPNLTTIGKQ